MWDYNVASVEGKRSCWQRSSHKACLISGRKWGIRLSSCFSHPILMGHLSWGSWSHFEKDGSQNVCSCFFLANKKKNIFERVSSFRTPAFKKGSKGNNHVIVNTSFWLCPFMVSFFLIYCNGLLKFRNQSTLLCLKGFWVISYSGSAWAESQLCWV